MKLDSLINQSAYENTEIFNHVSASLSSLDVKMVVSVPEGGNWKDIPRTIPSKRLQQIRESYERGEGSRSTYYGRLRRDRPAYTINTYFNRPGNGCHIHYDQDRVLSLREAARLQSFPDSFAFLGSNSSICKQIGNAVPPLLAFQIAKSLGEPGIFIDLFCGAGGMGLGFKWAGWMPIIANDIDPNILATYSKNVHSETILGSISDEEIFENILAVSIDAHTDGVPLLVLGGPPCQGFSTAGNKRTTDDPRNQLVWNYLNFINRLKPDGFIFENVTGILNIEGGKVFAKVHEAFMEIIPFVTFCQISAENYAIPQRRKRVILAGFKNQMLSSWDTPAPCTSLNINPSLFSYLHEAVSVEEAIGDLPIIEAGEDGCGKAYEKEPTSIYQAFMRGFISPDNYLDAIRRGDRQWQADE